MFNLQKISGYLVMGVLMFTAIVKLIGAFQLDPILEQSDPIFHFPYRLLFIFAGSIELAVVLTVLFAKRLADKQAIILWLVGCFSVYRIAIWAGDYSEPCRCLGTGFSWWPWLNEHKNGASITAFWMLVIGGLIYKYSNSIGRPSVAVPPAY